MEGNILDAMRYVGAGLAMIGAAGAGVGIGLSVQGALTGMVPTRDTYGNFLTHIILGIAFSEGSPSTVGAWLPQLFKVG